MQIEFKSKIWLWQTIAAPAAWHFITLPGEAADQVKFVAGQRKGFGSVRVKAKIGDTIWKTSLFPDKTSDSFLLPLKAGVRKTEKLSAGRTATVTLWLDV